MPFYAFQCKKPKAAPTEDELVQHFLSPENIIVIQNMFKEFRKTKQSVSQRHGDNFYMMLACKERNYMDFRDSDALGPKTPDRFLGRKRINYYFELDNNGKLDKLVTYYGEVEFGEDRQDLNYVGRATKSAYSSYAIWKKEGEGRNRRQLMTEHLRERHQAFLRASQASTDDEELIHNVYR